MINRSYTTAHTGLFLDSIQQEASCIVAECPPSSSSDFFGIVRGSNTSLRSWTLDVVDCRFQALENRLIRWMQAAWLYQISIPGQSGHLALLKWDHAWTLSINLPSYQLVNPMVDNVSTHNVSQSHDDLFDWNAKGEHTGIRFQVDWHAFHKSSFWPE